MRVLVTGQSGLEKKEFLQGVLDLCNDKYSSKADPEVLLDKASLGKAHIDHILDLEQEFQRRSRARNYLDMNETEFLKGKDEIFTQESEGYPPGKNIIVAMHLTYFRKKSIFHRVNWNSVRDFQPDMVITLIDDVYKVHSRVRKRNYQDDYVRSVSLKDILSWREAELMAAQTMAAFLYAGKTIQHYLIAMDHGAQIVYQLMFEKYKRKAYASFPITSAKADESLEKETTEFLKKLKQNFIVFNPYTIREKVIHDLVVRNLSLPLPYIGEIELAKGIAYPLEEILPILPDIIGQIITRDERMIRQSDAIIAYRPARSLGSQHELDYATSLGTCDVVAYHPKEDGNSPFALKSGTLVDSMEKLEAAISRLSKS